jgi:precorrin-3B synthase
VHADAGMLMAELGAAPGSGVVLHIAGCEKGCAHPRPAALTLVARAGRYDLVRHGVASDAPALCGLTVAQAARHVRQSA